MPNLDYIVVFGKELKNNQITPDFKYRLDTAILLAKNNHNLKIIITGGKKEARTLKTESSMGRDYLLNNNVVNEIIIEEESTNTIENIINIKNWVFLDKTYGLVSSEEHSPRCLIIWKEFYKAKAIVINKTNNIPLYEILQTKKDLKSIRKIKGKDNG